MTRLLKTLALLLLLLVLVAAAGLGYLMSTGLKARGEPGRFETWIARQVRSIVIGGEARGLRNPVALTPEVLADARAHFADHCAACHANDGSGDVEMNRGMFPRAPDMRAAATQELSDGELFYIIENGIRFTGMPAWGTGTPEGEEASWGLVHFIRHLPRLSPDEIAEMEALNPRSLEEWQQLQEEREFLSGGSEAPPAPQPRPHGGAHR